MESDTMDLQNYEFEKVSFSVPCDKRLLAEARKRGFYTGDTAYNKLFNKLFFEGGKLQFKPDLDDNFKARALPYLRAFMQSFAPKHEEKEAISALILSELVVIEDES